MICYMITNVLNGKRYIGITRYSLHARWMAHIYGARKGSNMSIARAIRKYGEENFTRVIIYEAVDRRELCAVERGLIAQYAPEYNITSGGDNANFSHAWWKNPETKTQRIIALKKSWNNPERRLHISKKSKLMWRDKEFARSNRQKIIDSMASPAARERKSIAAKKCLSDIKVRSKISKASKAYWAKPGSKELKSNSAKRQWSNPAFKAKLSSLQKARRVREYMDRLDFIYPIHIT